MIPIQEYLYDLPTDRIAHFPLEKRDESKLLVYHKGAIKHNIFKELPGLLPENSILFFNDTKVIPARLFFNKETGAEIEVFLLNPISPSPLLSETMKASGECTWHCTIGNLKRWKTGTLLTKKTERTTLHGELIDRENGKVKFTWQPVELSFAEIIDQVGITPLPPYIKREATDIDINRYQTVYSHYEGAVAAPTAGLHFTNEVLRNIEERWMEKDFLTLHVSAGTFQPVKTENALEHNMHREQIVATKKNISNLLRDDLVAVAVGTTSMRTLESLYWYGVKLLSDQEAEFIIHQTDPYILYPDLPTKKQALQAVADLMEKKNLELITGYTAIYIHPGYTFKVCKALITNFHLPGSTLMLLVAAFVGDDWKRIYQEALNHQYRFLSYGDSSILIP